VSGHAGDVDRFGRERIADKFSDVLSLLEENAPNTSSSGVTESGQGSTNLVEADHGRLKVHLRPMRGLRRLRSVESGHWAST
jgi:hypothetical protein